MQTISPGIWTRVAVSISNDDNDYTTKAFGMHACVYVCDWICVYSSIKGIDK